MTTSGQPWEWSFWNDTVTLYPTPDGAATIYARVMRNPTDFGVGSASGSSPDLPAPFHPILVTYAIAKAYLQQEDPVMAQQYLIQFQTDLDNIGRRYADVPAPQPMVANSRIATRYAVGTGGLRYSSSGGVIW